MSNKLLGTVFKKDAPPLDRIKKLKSKQYVMDQEKMTYESTI